ncbi:MAG: ester cyclase [Chloroflexota bacterium]|nr:ester cyclase [Chloroflexota bacterium]
MSVGDNKRIIERLLREVFNTGDVARLGEFLSPELEASGREYIQERRRLFPDLHYSTDEQIAEGDKVVTRGTMRGTNLGALHDGRPATGRPMSTSVVFICRIEGAKVVDLWMLIDHLSVREQLGIDRH